MEHFNHVKTVVVANVRASSEAMRTDEIIVDPVANPALEEDIKNGWRIVSVFPCVLPNAAAVIAVLGKC